MSQPNPRVLPLTVLSLCLLLGSAACRTPQPSLPAGPGLIGFDREPPAEAETFAAPSWSSGDRLAYRRGGLLRLPFRVELDEVGGLQLLQENTGVRLMLDADLGDLGQLSEADESQRITLDPVDARFSWPLWVGKRWACQFTRRAPGQPDLPLIVTYHCDGLETVEVPAGTFDCLRIWRTAQVAGEGDYIARNHLLWYSPEVGYLVRRLDDGVLTELEAYHRQ